MPRVSLPRHRPNRRVEKREPFDVELVVKERLDGNRRKVLEELTVVKRHLEFNAVLIDSIEMTLHVAARTVQNQKDVQRTYAIRVANRVEFTA